MTHLLSGQLRLRRRSEEELPRKVVWIVFSCVVKAIIKQLKVHVIARVTLLDFFILINSASEDFLDREVGRGGEGVSREMKLATEFVNKVDKLTSHQSQSAVGHSADH